MHEQRYNVFIDDAEIAENMPLDMAMVLVEAAFKKYYEQCRIAGMTISITAVAEDG